MCMLKRDGGGGGGGGGVVKLNVGTILYPSDAS